MKQLKIIVVVCLQVLLFASCLTTKQTNLLQSPGGDIPVYPPEKEIGEYVIKSGDELNVRINMMGDNTKTEFLFNLFMGGNYNINGGDNFNTNSYSQENKLRSFSVSPEGNIYFPYIGLIQAAGKTTQDVQTELEMRINKEILVEDACLVYVQLNNRYFSVIGESNAGRYPIAKEQLTIYQALAQSRDIHPYGNRSKVKIIRRTLNGTVIHTFNLRSAGIVNSEFYYIQPNDVIYIQPLGRQFVGMNSFGSIFAFISTVSSLGILVYNLTKK
jgi:polysaccharide export outer membrane protein